jgi:hypothetical protein
METLEQLREKYSNLCEEQCTLYEKIVKLEQQEVSNNFAVGECYLNTACDYFTKIVAIDNNILHCVVITDGSIQRDFYYLNGTKCWKKITPHQFRDIYHAVMRDIQDPDLEDEGESNWDIALKSIYDSINKEK